MIIAIEIVSFFYIMFVPLASFVYNYETLAGGPHEDFVGWHIIVAFGFVLSIILGTLLAIHWGKYGGLGFVLPFVIGILCMMFNATITRLKIKIDRKKKHVS